MNKVYFEKFSNMSVTSSPTSKPLMGENCWNVVPLRKVYFKSIPKLPGQMARKKRGGRVRRLNYFRRGRFSSELKEEGEVGDKIIKSDRHLEFNKNSQTFTKK